ncbi:MULTISPECIES: hypothetical protein [unclassified Nonomuraea]|uniref:hypothetical protein n=1 Tax=unclassified Nonomuraea TaxID=2593643 RepID=UPI0035BF3AA3
MLFSPGWRALTSQGAVLAAFTAGLVLGGVTSAGVLWLLSGLTAPVPDVWRHPLIVGVAVLGVLNETRIVRLPLPQNARQIPQDVLRRRARLGAAQFGFELGTGVRTYVSTTAPYVVAAGLLLSHPTLSAALLTGAGFGLGRALTAVLSYLARDAGWDARMLARLRTIAIGGSAVILAALVALAVLALLAVRATGRL